MRGRTMGQDAPGSRTPPGKRRCLRCDRLFSSRWPGLCAKCRRYVTTLSYRDQVSYRTAERLPDGSGGGEGRFFE